jgi:hypothetical protein
MREHCERIVQRAGPAPGCEPAQPKTPRPTIMLDALPNTTGQWAQPSSDAVQGPWLSYVKSGSSFPQF